MVREIRRWVGTKDSHANRTFHDLIDKSEAAIITAWLENEEGGFQPLAAMKLRPTVTPEETIFGLVETLVAIWKETEIDAEEFVTTTTLMFMEQVARTLSDEERNA